MKKTKYFIMKSSKTCNAPNNHKCKYCLESNVETINIEEIAKAIWDTPNDYKGYWDRADKAMKCCK
jgi:hypothetical protein